MKFSRIILITTLLLTGFSLWFLSDQSVDQYELIYIADKGKGQTYQAHVISQDGKRHQTLTPNTSLEGVKSIKPSAIGNYVAILGTLNKTKKNELFVDDLSDEKPAYKITPNLNEAEEIHESFIWSPDGYALAYSIFNHHSGKNDLYVFSLATKKHIKVNGSLSGHILPGYRWSPDNKYIAFLMADKFYGHYVLHLSNVREVGETKPQAVVTDKDLIQGQNFKWSPDANYLAYVVTDMRTNIASLNIFSIAHYKQVQIAQTSVSIAMNPYGTGLSFSWSPVSQQLAYSVVQNSGFTELYIINMGGERKPRSLTYKDELDLHYGVKADGLNNQTASTYKLVQQSKGVNSLLRGSRVNKVVAYGVQEFVWSPDGQKIAYTADFELKDKNLYIIDIDKKQANSVDDLWKVNSDFTNTLFQFIDSFEWSYDGKYIAYTVDSEQKSELFIKDMNMRTASRHVMDFKQMQRLSLVWSPKYHLLAFSGHDIGSGTLELYTFQPNGAVLTNLSQGLESDKYHVGRYRWSNDSEQIAWLAGRREEKDSIISRFKLLIANSDGKKMKTLGDTKLPESSITEFYYLN